MLTGKDVTAANVRKELATVESDQKARRDLLLNKLAGDRKRALAELAKPYSTERGILKTLLKKLELEEVKQ